MTLWLVVSVHVAIGAVGAVAIWSGTRRAGLLRITRPVVFLCLALFLSVQLLAVAPSSMPVALERLEFEWLASGSTLLIASYAAVLMLIPGLAVLSGVARRAEKYHDAARAIPAILHRVTNLELIYRLMMDCSLGATFVLQRVPVGQGAPGSFRLVAGNRELKELLGLDPADNGRGVGLGSRDPDGISWWIEDIAGKAHGSTVPVRSERAFVVQGQRRWYLLSATGRSAYVAGVIAETTQKRRESTEWALSANTDPLTKLSNRGHLTSVLETEAHRTSHGISRGFVVYFFDFDGFKTINDTLGHHVGDELLKQIADRLRETFRGIDLPMNASRPCIARYGGDEYVVIVPGLTRRDEVEALAEAFLARLRSPYRILDHDVTSTASIGVAICVERAARGQDVLRAADEAMYRAKQSGKDRFWLHGDEPAAQQGAA